MDWHTDDTWLDEYVDGETSADAVRMVEAHLAVCDRCRPLVADLLTIRAMSRSLEPQVPPPHVWARIAAASDAEPRRWTRFSLSAFGLQQAAAIAMTTVLGAALWWVGGRLAPATQPDLSIHMQTPVMTAGFGSVPLQVAEAHFADAIAGLEQMTSAEQDALDPDTMGVVQANLSVIDAAIDQSRAVLASEPDSEVAQQSLFEALRSKVAVLQDILALMNEMQTGDTNAARIVSGLNP
jgi:hypothetical protein